MLSSSTKRTSQKATSAMKKSKQASDTKPAKASPAKASPAKESEGYRSRPIRLPAPALPHLRGSHPHMDRIIERVGPFTLEAGHPEGPFASLVRAIVFQQLATKAASTIFGRLRALFPGEIFPAPAALLTTPDDALRGCGLSGQKLSYLRDLAQRIDRGELDLAVLPTLSDDEIIARLTTVRGIGRWSAQMFLIFYLGRLDVWPDGDLGVRHGVRLLHGYDDLPTAAQMQQAGQRFSPYASVASWYLWRLLDVPPEERALLLP